MTNSIIKNQSELKHIYNITLNHSLYIFFPLPNCVIDEITNAIIPIQILRLLHCWQQGTYHGRPTMQTQNLLLDIPTLVLHHSLQCVQRLFILIFLHLLAPKAPFLSPKSLSFLFPFSFLFEYKQGGLC